MPNINQYTRQNTSSGFDQTRNVQASDLADTTKLQGVSEDLKNLGSKINQVEEKRTNRLETINRIRSTDQFYNEAFQEFNRVQTEEDIIDPAVSEKFNATIREKANEYLTSFKGSPDAKAKLEADLLSHSGNFSRQLTQNSINAQRRFVMSKAGEQINALAQQVKENPALIGEVYKQADELVGDMSSALYAEDELDLINAAHEAVTLSALQSYVDAGQYEDARDLINENPFFMQNLSPQSQKQIVSQIQAGINDRDKVVRELQSKITAFRSAAEELNVDLSGAQVFEAITGIDSAQTPDQKIEEFARITNQQPDQLPPAVIAKIAYGVDLPSDSQVDFNKEFTPAGELTPKGIAGKIKAPFDSAAAARMYQQKVLGAITLFRNDGNKQALLSAMISFQKALDEGAIVREGDIVLQREAQGLSDRISLLVKPGQVVGDELVDEMEATINDFTAKSLESSKAQIDPYIEDAEIKGYRPLDYGLPREAYDQVFAGIKAKKKSGGTNKNVMTADEFLSE